MPRKPIQIEVIEEEDQRYLLKVFDDGSEERHLIVKDSRRKQSRRIDWSRKLSSGLKRGF
jgi:hypothetical protein